MKILLASNNSGKLAELRTLLTELCHIDDLSSLPGPREIPEENGVDFRENAHIKARACVDDYEGWILSDDSGLVVPELDGEPGIYSSRYGGEGASDGDNRKKLLSEIKAKKLNQPKAYFVCCLCLITESAQTHYFEGKWHGKIIDEERGKFGFGYDSIFVPEGMTQTSAELKAEHKNRISHRGLALQELKFWLEKRSA